jgi:hypothetical protein
MKFILPLIIFISSLAYGQVKDVVPGSYTPGFSSYVNFVKNPYCFLNDRNITESGTGAASRTTTLPLEGVASCSISGSSSGDKVYFDSRAMDAGLRGQNCEASFLYSGDGSKWKAYASDGTSSSPEVALTSLGNYPGTTDPQSATVTINYPCGSLASTFKPYIEATASSPSSIKVSSVYIGRARGVVSTPTISQWQAYTPTFTGFGTVSVQNFRWRQVGSNIEIEGRFTSGTSTATEARISFPGSYVASSSYVTVEHVGTWVESATFAGGFYALTEPSVSYLTFSAQSTANQGLTKVNGSSMIASGTSASVRASVKIDSLAGSTSLYTASNADTDWVACTPNSYQGLGTPTSVEVLCKRHGSDLLMKGKLVAGTTTATELRIGLPAWNGAQLTTAGTSVIPSLQRIGKANYGVASATFFGGGTILVEPSVTYLTSGVESSANSGIAKLNGNTILSSGNTFMFDARVPIAGWNNSNIIIASINEVVTNPGITKPLEIHFTAAGATQGTSCTASPCTIYNTRGGTPVVTRSAAGLYSVAFSGIFASGTVPTCFWQNVGGTNTACLPDGSIPTNTTVPVRCYTMNATANSDSAFSLLCKGQAP